MPELAAVRHRIARVDDEVHEHLLELAGVGHDGARWRRGVDTSAMSSPIRRCSIVLDARTRSLRSITSLSFWRAAEREELRGQAGGRARPAWLISRRCSARAVVCGRLSEQLGVAADHGEQVVEVVRDAGGEPPDRIHLLRLQEALLELSACSDVDGDAAELHVAADPLNDSHAVPQPEAVTVGVADAVLVLVILAATDRLSKVELREQAVFRVDDPMPEAVLLEPAGELVAEHALCLLADEREAIAQCVRLPDDRVDLTEDRRQSRAASFGFGMRGLLLGELQA